MNQPLSVQKNSASLDNYQQTLTDLIDLIKKTHIRSAVMANIELVKMHSEIGKIILENQELHGWRRLLK